MVIKWTVMKNRKAYENTLSIILDEPDIKMEEVKVEQVILNRYGKGRYVWMRGGKPLIMGRSIWKWKIICMMM